MFRILFLSSGESGRSLMAGVFARRLMADDIEINCANEDQCAVHPVAEVVMDEVQTSIRNEASLYLPDISSVTYDAVVILCDKNNEECPQFPGSPALINWFIPDPLEKVLNEEELKEEFRCIRNEIMHKISHLVDDGYLEAIRNQRHLLGSLIENMTDGVLAHDNQRRIFYFNRAAQRLTGYRYSEVIGRDCHEVFTEIFCGGHCNFCDLFTTGNGSKTRKSFTRPDGRVRDFELNSFSINSPDQSVFAALVIFSDVTKDNQQVVTHKKSDDFYGIIGEHPAIQRVVKTCSEVAGYDVPVLIQGDSGTGKEMVANAIHKLSSRAKERFVPVNCGALPESLLESELFGHVKGAFTGAIRDKKGRFELADGGIIFLDEIGEIPLYLQVKLLRVLQEMSFTPVGGEEQISVDTRVICATNRNLRHMVEEGKFREDLYYRLAVVPILVPSLRERMSDIPMLSRHFLEQYQTLTKKAVKGITKEALDRLLHYHWPGNVRELANAIQFAIIKSKDDVLTESNLPPEILDESLKRIKRKSGRPGKLDLEKVVQTLKQTDGNKSKAAKILGVSRPTLYNFLKTNKVLSFTHL